MTRRNDVIESVRQKCLRMLANERDHVIGSLQARLRENRAGHRELVEEMHRIQSRINTLQDEAEILAERNAKEEARLLLKYR